MIRILFLLLGCTTVLDLSAQQKVQALQTTRLAIFKNGTCFVKREGDVMVSNQSFYIAAPERALYGSYWLSAGKEAGIRSAVVKADTFTIKRVVTEIRDYLNTAIGKPVTLYRDATLSYGAGQGLSGVLQSYDARRDIVAVLTASGQTVIASASSFSQVAISGTPMSAFMGDTIAMRTKVNLDKPVTSIRAGTLALETGIEWYPSYLIRILNNKEARLEMKATIVNNSGDYRNTPVDIIIGSPEMFYGKDLDPVCANYLMGTLVPTGSVAGYNFTTVQANYSSGYFASDREKETNAAGDEKEDKEGQKYEDLFYYQLGNLDLEMGARVIVPVITATVEYTDVYTADLDVNSTDAGEDKPLEVYHGYRFINTTNAPFTTGAAIVLNPEGQPLAQSRMTYTPVKGATEVRLSKAIDVTVKNEENELRREKVSKTLAPGSALERVFYTGQVTIVNYKKQAITIKLRKAIEGSVQKQSDKGITRKQRGDGSTTNTVLEWEITLEAGGTKTVSYDYSVIK